MATKIVGVRVQDITNQVWFRWENGEWDNNPECLAEGPLYVAFYVENQGYRGHNYDFLFEFNIVKSQYIGAGESAGAEYNGTMTAGDKTFTIGIMRSGGAYDDSLNFQIKAIPEEPEEPPEEPPPSNGKMCLLTAIGLAPLLLVWIRNAVRPLLPLWLTKGYYSLSFWMLNKG